MKAIIKITAITENRFLTYNEDTKNVAETPSKNMRIEDTIILARVEPGKAPDRKAPKNKGNMVKNK